MVLFRMCKYYDFYELLLLLYIKLMDNDTPIQVEKILTKRKIKQENSSVENKYEYLIKWKNK